MVAKIREYCALTRFFLVREYGAGHGVGVNVYCAARRIEP